MALVLCPGCGRHVEDNVKRCPHCGRTKPFPYRLVMAFGIFLVLLLVFLFNGTIARFTMAEDLRAGTAKACVGDVMPTLLAEALPGSDWSTLEGRCRPTWFKALRYGFPGPNDNPLRSEITRQND